MTELYTADGEKIEIGQTLYHTGNKITVEEFGVGMFAGKVIPVEFPAALSPSLLYACEQAYKAKMTLERMTTITAQIAELTLELRALTRSLPPIT